MVELEPLARAVGQCGAAQLERVLRQADQRLTGVWRDMFQVLMVHGLRASNNAREANILIEGLGEPWRRYLSVSA